MPVTYLAFVFSVHLVLSATGQNVPPSPCPSIFHYEKMNTPVNHYEMSLKGVITVESHLPINLTVKMEIPIRLTSKYGGRLEKETNDEELSNQIRSGIVPKMRFNLFYPRYVQVPKITFIEVNNQIVCYSSPIYSRAKTKFAYVYTVKQVDSGYPPVVNDQGISVYNWNTLSRKKKPIKNYPQSVSDVIGSQDAPEKSPQENPTSKWNVMKDSPVIHHKEDGLTEDIVSFVDALKPPQTFQFVQIPQHSTTDRTNTDIIDVSGNCGRPIRPNPLIVGGQGAKRGEWPWLVPIFKILESGLEFMCAATLVSKNYLLTAAHCVKDVVRNRRLLAGVGRYNLSNWIEPGSEMREISNVYIHPDYNSDNLYSDIAVLKLKHTVTMNEYVNVACLWMSEEETSGLLGTFGYVFGWGNSEHGRKVTEIPMRVKMPIVSKEKCIYSNDGFKSYATNRTFCAGARDGSGPCNGDSGSGFLIPRTDIYGNVRWFVRGIVSLSLPKQGVISDTDIRCNLSEYVVFTDIAKFRNWLSDFLMF